MPMHPTYSRRQMLQILLGTAPALSLLDPTLAELWPNEELQREPHAPLEFLLSEDGYLMEANFSLEEVEPKLPTAREYYWSTGEFEDLSPKEQDDAILTAFDWEECILPDLPELDPDYDSETIAECREQLQWCRERLDEPIEWERLGDREAALLLPQGAGILLYESIRERDKLGLGLVEGDHPGSSFVGVRYQGDLDELNRRLVKGGYNAVMRAEPDNNSSNRASQSLPAPPKKKSGATWMGLVPPGDPRYDESFVFLGEPQSKPRSEKPSPQRTMT